MSAGPRLEKIGGRYALAVGAKTVRNVPTKLMVFG